MQAVHSSVVCHVIPASRDTLAFETASYSCDGRHAHDMPGNKLKTKSSPRHAHNNRNAQSLKAQESTGRRLEPQGDGLSNLSLLISSRLPLCEDPLNCEREEIRSRRLA